RKVQDRCGWIGEEVLVKLPRPVETQVPLPVATGSMGAAHFDDGRGAFALGQQDDQLRRGAVGQVRVEKRLARNLPPHQRRPRERRVRHLRARLQVSAFVVPQGNPGLRGSHRCPARCASSYFLSFLSFLSAATPVATADSSTGSVFPLAKMTAMACPFLRSVASAFFCTRMSFLPSFRVVATWMWLVPVSLNLSAFSNLPALPRGLIVRRS